MKRYTTTTYFFPLLLVLAETVVYLSNDMYLPALPQILDALNTTASKVQMTLTTWFLGTSCLQLFVGPLSDHFGRKPILLIGGMLFVSSSILCAIASNITVLLLARFIQGTTVAFIIVAGYSSIHELFDQKNAIKTLAVMNGISVFAPAIGPFLGGIIISFTSFQFIFWMLGSLGLILFLLLAHFMPETNPHGKVLNPLKLNPILNSYKRVFLNLNFVEYAFIFCFIFVGMIAWIAYSPFLFIKENGYTPLTYGCFQTIFFGCFAVGCYINKPLIENFSLNLLIQLGLLLALAGSCASVFLSFLNYSILVTLFPLVFFSLGAGLIFAPLNRLTIETSTESMGKKVAVFSSLTGISCVTSGSLVSLLYNGTSRLLTLIMGTGAVFAFGLNLNRTRKMFKHI